MINYFINGGKSMVLTKQQIAQECYKRVFKRYYPSSGFSTGSTVTKEILDAIAYNYGVSTSRGKVETARGLSRHFQFPWSSSYCSENTISGGGGTVTKAFYEELYKYL